MKKRTLIVSCTALGSALAVASLLAFKPLRHGGFVEADERNFSLNFSSSKNKVTEGGSGNIDALTALNNPIRFIYENVTPSSGNWGEMANGGYLLNRFDPSLDFNNRISDLYSVSATFDGSLTVSYADDINVANGKYAYSASLVSGTPFALTDATFVKISATADTVIQELVFEYRCESTVEVGGTFEIETPADLVKMAEIVNGGYGKFDASLANDIDMQDVAFVGIGTEVSPYQGEFFGNGFTIDNLTITSDGDANDGLFAVAKDATFHDLKLDVTIANGGQHTGGFLGYGLGDINVNGITVTGSITGSAGMSNEEHVLADAGVAGIVGVTNGGSSSKQTNIEFCYNYASVTNNGRIVGGIFGKNVSGNGAARVSDCKNYGTITGVNFGGGIVGVASFSGDLTDNPSLIDGCANYGSVSINNAGIGGGIVAMAAARIINNYQSGGFELGTGGYAGDTRFNATGTSISIKARGIDALAMVGYVDSNDEFDPGYTGLDVGGADKPVTGVWYSKSNGTGYICGFLACGGEMDDSNWAGWSGTTAHTEFSGGGSGTAEDPYIMLRPFDYFAFRGLTNVTSDSSPWTGYVKLGKDIDFDYHLNEFDDSNVSENVSRSLAIGTCIQFFGGHFDGDGHSIKELGIGKSNDWAGFFRDIYGGTVENVIFDSPYVVGGKADGSSYNLRVGAACGKGKNATFNNVHVYGGQIEGSREVASILAGAHGACVVTNCSSSANIISHGASGTSMGAGIVGFSTTEATSLTVRNCEFTGTITSAGQINGGIVAYITTNSTTNIIENCVNRGTVVTSSQYSGGILGQCQTKNAMTITGCANLGEIRGSSFVGGIMGGSLDGAAGQNLLIEKCANFGFVHTSVAAGGTATYVGGVAGILRIQNTNRMNNVWNFGNVTGTNTTSCGAVIGLSRWTLSNLYHSTGAVITTAHESIGKNEKTDLTTNVSSCDPMTYEEWVAHIATL